MPTEGTALAFASYNRGGHSLAAKFDLNQAIRAFVRDREHEPGRRNIAVILDLAPELPKSTANSCEIQKVLFALFTRARKAIVETGKLNGTILIRTALKAGNIQVSISDNGVGDPFANVFQSFFEKRTENMADLCVCAEIVQDQAGELYAWRQRCSSFTTIFIDLPV